MKKKVTATKRRGVLLVVLLVCSVAVAVCSVLVMPMLYEAIIDTVVTNMMILSPSSRIFPEWKDPPLPLYSRFFIFNVENPDAVLEGARPVVTEKGPYVYRVEVPRQNITFHDNGTMTNSMFYTYYYEPALSIGPETDVYTMVNPVAVATTVLAEGLSPSVKKALSEAMDILNETIFMNRSVGEILWGYEDGFLTVVDKLITIPGWETNQFGFLWGRNESGLGFYTVYDGTLNQSMLNRFERFNGWSELDWWYSPEANMLNGTDGTMYHPFIDREEMLELFHPDLCRSLPFHYEKDIEYEGVPLFKFVLANYSYANGTDHPPNAGFYKDDMWAPSGILRQDPCRFGQPIGVSNPHFLDGDPVLYESVDGVNPVKEDHETILAVEGRMGMPYIFSLRLQINSLMEPVQGIRQVKNVPRLYFPLMWFEQSVQADDYIVSMYEKGFVTTEKIMDSLQWIFFSVSVIVLMVGSYSLAHWCRHWRLVKEAEKNDALEDGSPFEMEGGKKLYGIDGRVLEEGGIFMEEEDEVDPSKGESTPGMDRESSTDSGVQVAEMGDGGPPLEGERGTMNGEPCGNIC